MREMHEIESQRAIVPPVPASAVKDQLNDDEWALQYLEDGKNFHVSIGTSMFKGLFIKHWFMFIYSLRPLFTIYFILSVSGMKFIILFINYLVFF